MAQSMDNVDAPHNRWMLELVGLFCLTQRGLSNVLDESDQRLCGWAFQRTCDFCS